MKELSIEEKAQAYDIALDKIKMLLGTGSSCSREELEYVFPELKESEGEKIRKKIIKLVKEHSVNHERCQMENWLENQGEHAKFIDSIQVGDKVTRNKDGVLVNLSQLNRVAKKDEKQGEQTSNFKVGDTVKRPNSNVTYKVTNIDNYGFQLDGGHWFKLDRKSEFELVEQKPAKWNKNDKVLLDETLHFIREFQQSDRCINEGDMQNSVTCENWLKSLKDRVRPQSTWKPSDEQMEYLAKAITTLGNEGDNKTSAILYELRTDLKKLKE